MTDFIQEAKEILQLFGIELPEDQPWVLEPEYSKKDHFLIHLIQGGRGICMEYKGDHISWFLPKVEEQLSAYGIDVDLSYLVEKHRETDGFFIWLAEIRDILKSYEMVLLYLDGLDDLIFFEILPGADTAKLNENSFFHQLIQETEDFLDPDGWGTITVEDV
jgi:hypothetical protein